MLSAAEIDLNAGSTSLLRHACLQLQAGSLHVILGANGAGKSTLLSVLAGARSPTRGDVMLNGRAMSAWSLTEQARRRAVITQHDALDADISAWASVSLGRHPYGDADSATGADAIEQAMRRSGCLALAGRSITGLSGGERARVRMARALAQLDHPLDEPRYLLMDEPTASLDLAWQHHTLALARELARGGLGVLAVLHDPNLALRYADQVTLLRRGTVVDSGTPEQVLQAQTVSELYQLPLRRLALPDGGNLLIPS